MSGKGIEDRGAERADTELEGVPVVDEFGDVRGDLPVDLVGSA